MVVLDVTLRAARPDEAEAITDLAVRSKGHWGYDEAFLAGCREDLRIEPASCDGVRVVVASTSEGRLAGFFRVIGEPPVGMLDELFVDPWAIGLGVGGRLLAEARDLARSLGMLRLRLDADPHAEAFYRRFGARRTGSTPSAVDPDRHLPTMELTL